MKEGAGAVEDVGGYGFSCAEMCRGNQKRHAERSGSSLQPGATDAGFFRPLVVPSFSFWRPFNTIPFQVPPARLLVVIRDRDELCAFFGSVFMTHRNFGRLRGPFQGFPLARRPSFLSHTPPSSSIYTKHRRTEERDKHFSVIFLSSTLTYIRQFSAAFGARADANFTSRHVHWPLWLPLPVRKHPAVGSWALYALFGRERSASVWD